MLTGFRNFWAGEGGAGTTLKIAIPLILSTSSYTIMNFVDRMFLAEYDGEAFAAVTPGGMVSFIFIALFMGTAGYVSTFVAQYTGAQKPRRVGASLWQGIYFSVIAWALMAPLALLGDDIFRWAGHAPNVARLESLYFKFMILGSGFVIFNSVFSSFYSGQGKTWTILCVRFTGMAVLIPLDYALIFGNWGFPRMGLAGAALATVLAPVCETVFFGIMIFSAHNRRAYDSLRAWRFDPELFRRLIRYGLPNGVQFMVDIIGFTFFLLMVGRLGETELMATNAAWTLNHLIFMPMIGFAIALSIVVGQEVGRGRIEVARRATMNSFIMVFSYMTVIALLFALAPEPFLWVLLRNKSEFGAAAPMAAMLMRFVALYSLFDSVGIIYSSAIKGAGDTRFAMRITLILSFLGLVLPSYLTCVVWKLPIQAAWTSATIYIIVVSMAFYWRYRAGYWEKMRVIEYFPEPLPSPAPVVEI
ncbi:MAG: MATE family efflux transporter [Candidatus Sumerlaeota bacterium]|nr:MATE family efflux transporter [Candidatus Sumerlaeota bacterium]